MKFAWGLNAQSLTLEKDQARWYRLFILYALAELVCITYAYTAFQHKKSYRIFLVPIIFAEVWWDLWKTKKKLAGPTTDTEQTVRLGMSYQVWSLGQTIVIAVIVIVILIAT